MIHERGVATVPDKSGFDISGNMNAGEMPVSSARAAAPPRSNPSTRARRRLCSWPDNCTADKQDVRVIGEGLGLDDGVDQPDR